MILHSARLLLISEYHLYREHLLELDDNSRQLRFGIPTSDHNINHFCDKIEANPDQHIIFGIFGDQLQLVGVGHVATGSLYELAFSVLLPYQRNGMGTVLFDCMSTWCINRGHHRAYMVCLSNNTAVRKIAAKYAIIMHTTYGETEANLEFPWATPISILDEVLSTNIAYFDFFTKNVSLNTKQLMGEFNGTSNKDFY